MKAWSGWIAMLALWGGSAWGYIPPSEYIIKQLVKKRSGTVSVRIRSVVAVIENGQPTAARFRMMTQLDVPQRKIRVRAYDDANKELYATWREIPVDAGIASDSDRVAVSPTFEMLADPRPEVVVGNLNGWEIPIRTEAELLKQSTEEERRAVEETYLGRMGTVLVWQIGPRKRSAFQPQLWIEKDTFLPLRLVADSAAGRFDIRFSAYRFTREFPFPRVIEVRQADSGNHVLFQEMAQDVWINPEGNEMTRGFAGDGFTEAGNQAASTIRDLILTSVKVLR